MQPRWGIGIVISQMSGDVYLLLIFKLSHSYELVANAVTPFYKSQTDCVFNEVSFFFPPICFSFSSVHSVVHYSTNEAIKGSGGSLVPRRGPGRIWKEAVS